MATPDELLGILLNTEDTADARRAARFDQAEAQGGGFGRLGAVTGEGVKALFDLVTGRRGDIQRKRAQNQEVLDTFTSQVGADVQAGKDPAQAQIDALVNAAQSLQAIGSTDEARQLMQQVVGLRQQAESAALARKKLKADTAFTEARTEQITNPPPEEPRDELTRLQNRREQLRRLRDANPAEANKVRELIGEIDSRITKITEFGRTEADERALEPTTKKNLEEQFIQQGEQLANLKALGEKFDPRFLQAPTQLLVKGINAAEKFLGRKPSEDEARLVDGYTDFTQSSLRQLNLYIKAITGAQMSIQEADRIISSMPNPGQGPTEFLSALDSVTQELEAARRRTAAILAAGDQTLLNRQRQNPDKDLLTERYGSLDQWKPSAQETTQAPATGGAAPDDLSGLSNEQLRELAGI